jgi:ribonuclease HI
MVRAKWKIKFSWVKAHAGIYGNEMADRLAKEAARSDGTNYGYSRIQVPYTVKQQKKPSKNGKNNGQKHPRQRQQNSISQQSWTE